MQRTVPRNAWLTLIKLYAATGCAVSLNGRLSSSGVEGSTKFQRAGRISNWTQDTNSGLSFTKGRLI